MADQQQDQKRMEKTQIVQLLKDNARIGNDEIAERLEMDTQQVTSLIKEMEEERTILGYNTLVNEENLGQEPVHAIIEVEVAPERDSGFDRVARLISGFPEVRTLHLLSGTYDLSLEVTGRSLQEVAFFVASKLSLIEGVRSTRTHFLLKKYKEAGFVFHEEEEYERLKVAP